MTALAMAKWFETPSFYPLSLSHHLLPLLHAAAGSLPSNLQPPDSPRRDPELPALQTPPTSALWVLPQIPLEKYYWWWLVWRVGVPGQRPSFGARVRPAGSCSAAAPSAALADTC